MDSHIGATIELPQHLLEGSNQRYLIKYNNHDDNLCNKFVDQLENNKSYANNCFNKLDKSKSGLNLNNNNYNILRSLNQNNEGKYILLNLLKKKFDSDSK